MRGSTVETDGGDRQSKSLHVHLFSFGFKHGTPLDAQLLFDVRFLPNPYWQEDLRAKSGLQQEVSAYVIDSGEGKQFLQALLPLLDCVMKQSAASGKEEIRIGIGCTGGRHRSVAVVEYLAGHFEANSGWQLQVQHRHIDKD
jgi:RNase adapter protein RapZ